MHYRSFGKARPEPADAAQCRILYPTAQGGARRYAPKPTTAHLGPQCDLVFMRSFWVFMAKILEKYAIGHFLTVNRYIRWRINADTHFIASDVENLDRNPERWKDDFLTVTRDKTSIVASLLAVDRELGVTRSRLNANEVP